MILMNFLNALIIFFQTMMPVKLGHTPAGAALRQLVHYLQLYNKYTFNHYDHGPIKNLQLYGIPTPPEFDLSLVSAPVYLYRSLGDNISHELDVALLWNALGNPVEDNIMADPTFDHTDFVWGTQAKSLLYDKTITVLKSFGDE
jgi:lysosomal acid lipase/cholesteryl ester hydrolase